MPKERMELLEKNFDVYCTYITVSKKTFTGLTFVMAVNNYDQVVGYYANYTYLEVFKEFMSK